LLIPSDRNCTMRLILSILIGVFAIVPRFCEALKSQINQYLSLKVVHFTPDPVVHYMTDCHPWIALTRPQKNEKKEKYTPKKLYTLLRIGLYTIFRIQLYTILRNIQSVNKLPRPIISNGGYVCSPFTPTISYRQPLGFILENQSSMHLIFCN